MNSATRDPFSKYITWSLLAHVGLVLLFSIKHFYFPSDIKSYAPSIKVDLVALPDKKIKEIKKITAKKIKEPVQKVKPRPKPKAKSKAPKVNLNKKRNLQKKALEKLRAQRAIEALRKETKPTQSVAKQEFKGNVLSAGIQLSGLNKLEHGDYQGDIDTHVKQYWELPEWLAQANLTAVILIKINSQGYVIEKKILKSSGNPEYDEIVLNTVQKASPFPKPSKKFINIVKIDGITLGFPE